MHRNYSVLMSVSIICIQLAPDQGLQPADQPTDMRRRCEEEAQEIVRHANSSTGQPCVENENLTDLISRLTAILLQIKVNFRESILLILITKQIMLIYCLKIFIHRLYQVPFVCIWIYKSVKFWNNFFPLVSSRRRRPEFLWIQITYRFIKWYQEYNRCF